MDPAAAIGLAVNIMTVIDLGCKVIGQAQELYQAGGGSTKENARIITIVDDLRGYSLELSASRNFATKHERAIESLGRDCATVSDQLIAILEKLQLSKKSRWRSLTTTWSAFRKKNDIATLEARLGEYRAQISLRLMAALNDKHSGLKSQLDNIEVGAERMASVSATELKSLREDIVSLLSPPDQDSGPPAYSLHYVGEQLGSLQKIADNTQRQTRILKQLHFSDIHSREDGIKDANEKTFNWILEPEPEPEDGEEEAYEELDYSVKKQIGDRKKARALLQSWLASGCGALHLSGKAGAGKSTLMKLIYNHPRTKELLREWAGDKTLVFVPFFFWNSGSQLQMSVEGLYRSLLYHVLTQCPRLIPEILPDQWRRVSSSPFSIDAEMLRPPDIEAAFKRLLEKPISSDTFKFCFLIDGLDEFKGHEYEHKKLAVQLRDWTKCDDIKVCVSSRPLPEFTYTFSSKSRLELHELTASDMWNLGCDMFEKDENFDRVCGKYKELVNDVVRQAEGVLLWANVVFKAVIREVGLHSPVERLKRKIFSFPREMNDLYDRMFSDMDANDRHMAGQMLFLNLVPTHHHFNLVCLFWLNDMTEPSFPSASHLARMTSEVDYSRYREAMTRQIAGVSRGLLTTQEKSESNDTDVTFGTFHSVEFFHRTVRDWLNTTTMQKYQGEAFPGLDFPRLVFRLRIAELSIFHFLWPKMDKHTLNYHVTHRTLQPYSRQYTFNDMELYYAHLGPSITPAFVTLLSKTYSISLGGNEQFDLSCSYLHHAACLHQRAYMQRGIGGAESSKEGLESNLDPMFHSGKDMSLLFNAASPYSDPELVSILLSAGFSTKFQLNLYYSVYAIKDLEWTRTLSFWTAWVARFSAYTWDDFIDGISWREDDFNTMELLLCAAPQHEVVILSYKGYGIISISLREIIRQCRPKNMDRLMDLLPPESQDSSVWPHIKEFKHEWGYDGPDDKESDPERMNWALEGERERVFYDSPFGTPVGVASETEIFTLRDQRSIKTTNKSAVETVVRLW